MSVRIFVPRDSTALALGADAVAAAIAEQAQQRGIDVQIVRNGSRGMMWLEPLVELETPAGRIGYGPVCESDVASLFKAGFHLGEGGHPLSLGLVDAIPYLRKQERLTFARVGVIDPLSLDDYLAHDGYRGLEQALQLEPSAVVAAVTDSGLRGRGGAAGRQRLLADRDRRGRRLRPSRPGRSRRRRPRRDPRGRRPDRDQHA